MWKRKSKSERVAWYRAPGYKGDLTEAEKRQLDAFRSERKHPAATTDELPEEVQRYIGRIELELYDAKQAAAGQALVLSGVGAALLGFHYIGCLSGTPLTYAFDVLLLLVPWLFYRRRWKMTADEFLPPPLDSDALNPADEALRAEWELEFITRSRMASGAK
jgi:hypothetical protein